MVGSTDSADKELATRIITVFDTFEKRFSLLENYNNVILKNTVQLRSDFLLLLAKLDETRTAERISSACRRCGAGSQTLAACDVQMISRETSNKDAADSSFQNGVYSESCEGLAHDGDDCKRIHSVRDSLLICSDRKIGARLDSEVSILTKGISTESNSNSSEFSAYVDFGIKNDYLGVLPTANTVVEECAHAAYSKHPILTANMTSSPARMPSSEWRGNDSVSGGCSSEESRESSLELVRVYSPRTVNPIHRRHRLNTLLEQQRSKPSWSKYLKQHIGTMRGWGHLWFDMVKWVFGIQPRNTALGIEGSKIIDPFSPFHGGNNNKFHCYGSADISVYNVVIRC
jgi:hypothetical protein